MKNDTNFEDPYSSSECDFISSTALSLEDHKNIHRGGTYVDRTKSSVRNTQRTESSSPRASSPLQGIQRTRVSSSQPVRSSYEQPSPSSHKKRGASASPNFNNVKSRKSQRKNSFKTVSQGFVFYDLLYILFSFISSKVYYICL